MNPDQESNPQNQPVTPSPQPQQPTYPQTQQPVPPAPTFTPETQPITPQQPIATTPQPEAQQQPVTPITPQPVYGYGSNLNTGLTPPPPSGGRNKKKLFIIGGVSAAAVILLSVGAVFGLYLPNKPENAYKTALSRTGKTVEKLVSTGTEESKIKGYANSEMSGSVDVTVPGGTKYSGTFGTKYDDKQSDSNFTYKDSSTNQNLSLQFMTDLAENKTIPDMYIKLGGLSTLGIDEMAPQLKDYDDKWISISSQYLESQIPAEELKKEKKNEFTQKDATELARIVTATTREYVFSNDPAKSVLVQKSYVGEEKLGDMNTFHYKVGINNDNAKKYCKALVQNVMASESYKHIPGINADTIDKDRENAIKECDEGEDADANYTFDMWVDKKYKLVHKLRFTDEKDSSTWYEIGQSYKKGDTIPLFMTFHSDKDHYDAKVTLEVDVDKSITKGGFEMTAGNTDKYTVNAKFESKPFNGDVKVEKPAGAIPIEDVFKAFGVDPGVLGAATSGLGGGSASQDTERQTDIKAAQSQVEAYYAERGYYPTLAQMNDKSWRDQNLFGMDEEAVKDPSGSSSSYAQKSSASQYGYDPTECNTSGCQKYVLSATLSGGNVFTKESLN